MTRTREEARTEFFGTGELVTAPFLVDSPESVWLVHEGRLDVFSTPTAGGVEGGPLRFLYSADPGEMVLGMAPAEGIEYPVTAVAVPIGGTMVSKTSADELRQFAGTAGGGATTVAWVRDLMDAMGRAVAARNTPRMHLTLQEGEGGTLSEGQHVTVGHNAVVWVRVDEGQLQAGDSTRWPILPGDPPFPIAHGLWLTAAEDSRFTSLSTTEVADSGNVYDSLVRVSRFFMAWAGEQALLDEEHELERFQARSEEEHRTRRGGLRRLAETIGKFDEDPGMEAAGGDTLLAAAKIVGRAVGVTFKPAPEWERANQRNDPLQAICRASRVRSRQIGLKGEWWKVDSGHFLAFKKNEERTPVALLWSRKGYTLVTPEDGTRQPVTDDIAVDLEPLGFSFYKPFPDRPLTGRDLMGIALESVRGEVGWLLSIATATAIIGLIMPWATNRMLTDVVPVGSSSSALVLTIALIAVQVGSSAFDAAKAFVLVRIEGRSNARLQAGVVDRLLSLPVQFYRRFTVGDLASRASGINAVRDLLSGAAGTSMLAGVFALVYLLQLWWYSWRLALVALAIMIVAVGGTAFFVFRSVRWQRIQQEMAGKLSGFTVQLMGAIPKVRVTAAEDRAFAQWSQRFRTQKDAALQSGLNDVVVTTFNTVLPLLASMALFGYAGWMTIEAKEYALAPGTFVAFNAAFGTFFAAVVSLSNTLVTVLIAIPMLERAQPILSALPEVADDRSDPGELTGHIEASHVTFRYKEDGPTILDDVSFSAAPGDFIAFVGPSGSGKSTSLRLLLGFESPEAGAIYYDRQDLATLDVTAVRSQIGVVLQTSGLSQGDIFQNIVGSAPLTLDDAWEAAEAAGLDRDIEQMPMQMHTVVSEGGSTLSGGQRQRLMIARALVRKPRVILFDEATSALDNKTQAMVSESLEKTNATRVVIAHRLSTVKHADRIYVMDRGKVVQQGTFEELSEAPGMFAELVKRQLT